MTLACQNIGRRFFVVGRCVKENEIEQCIKGGFHAGKILSTRSPCPKNGFGQTPDTIEERVSGWFLIHTCFVVSVAHLGGTRKRGTEKLNGWRRSKENES